MASNLTHIFFVCVHMNKESKERSIDLNDQVNFLPSLSCMYPPTTYIHRYTLLKCDLCVFFLIQGFKGIK